jgi:ElaB/YqjD/DUF883 family membrane-anchored ribosome-binding protein
MTWRKRREKGVDATAGGARAMYFMRRRTNPPLVRCGMVGAGTRSACRRFPRAMEEILIMPTTMKDAYDKAEDAMDQISRLRAQVETLMREKAVPAMGAAAERVEGAAHDAADVMRGKADALAGVVRDKPLTAIAVAIALGFLFGRAGR